MTKLDGHPGERTPPSSMRLPRDVKAAAQRRAADERVSLTSVVVAYLRKYGRYDA